MFPLKYACLEGNTHLYSSTSISGKNLLCQIHRNFWYHRGFLPTSWHTHWGTKTTVCIAFRMELTLMYNKYWCFSWNTGFLFSFFLRARWCGESTKTTGKSWRLHPPPKEKVLANLYVARPVPPDRQHSAASPQLRGVCLSRQAASPNHWCLGTFNFTSEEGPEFQRKTCPTCSG